MSASDDMAVRPVSSNASRAVPYGVAMPNRPSSPSSDASASSQTPHRWQFIRTGGADQVIFRTGEDIARIAELDQKL